MSLGCCKEKTNKVASVLEFENQAPTALWKVSVALENTLDPFTNKPDDCDRLEIWLGLRSLWHRAKLS